MSVRTVLITLCLLHAASRPVMCTDLQITPNSASVTPGQVVVLKAEPALNVAREDLFVTIGGRDASVDSIGADGVRVQVPRGLKAGSAEVRLVAINRQPGVPHVQATAELTVPARDGWHMWLSGGIVLLTTALVLALLYLAVPTLNADRWNKAMFLMYDNSTDSYSVKRFQVVLWFFTLFPIVLYAFVLTELQSGLGMSLQLPQNALYLLGMSAGTAIVAHGIERTRHVPAKSADQRASWRDLFQEQQSFSFSRFQIVCWTVVSCVFFAWTYWTGAHLDPAAIPDIPITFWLLMGLSSAAYVGAKVAESGDGAPRILSAVVTPGKRALILRVQSIALRFDMTPEGWFTLQIGKKPAGQVTFVLGADSMVTQQIDANTYRITVPLNGRWPRADGEPKEVDFTQPITISLTNPDGQTSADVPIVSPSRTVVASLPAEVPAPALA